jgi:hypothetical protein
MAKSKTMRKRAPKHVLKLPDLEQSKSAVLNSLTSPSRNELTIKQSENSSNGTVQNPGLPSTRLWLPGTVYLLNRDTMLQPQ